MYLTGQHTKSEAEYLTVEVSSLFQRLGQSEFVIDLSTLKGYEPGARTLWQDRLSELRRSIHTLTMVGASPLLRMTGAAVCLYAGIKMRFVDDIEEAFSPGRRGG